MAKTGLCLECPLRKKTEVPYSGPTNAKIVWVGESPGKSEIFARPPKPFIGDAGVLLRETAKGKGLSIPKTMLANSGRCMINKDEMSAKEITKVLKCCRVKLEKLLHFMKPKAVVCLGDIALRQIERKSGITKAIDEGWRWNKEFNCWVLPMFHPAYILRNPSKKLIFEQSMDSLIAFIRNKFKPLKEDRETDYQEVQSLDFLREMVLPFDASIDTETQGKDWMDENFLMLSYSISLMKGQAYDVILYEEGDEDDYDFTITWPRKEEGKKRKAPTTVYVKRADNFERKVLDLLSFVENPKIRKYLFAGNYDLHSIHALCRRNEIEPPKIQGYAMDVQAAAHVIDENNFQLASLVAVQRAFTDVRGNYNLVFEQKHDKADMLAVPTHDRTPYACADADITLQAGLAIREELRKKENFRLLRYTARFVQPTLHRSLFWLEENGAAIDLEELPEVQKAVRKVIKKNFNIAMNVAPDAVKEMELHQKKGLKLTRDDLVRDVLFNERGFGLPPVKKTKGGDAWSVDKEVRKKLLASRIPAPARRFLKAFDEWSEYHTLDSRYLNGFRKHVKYDGRVHSSNTLTRAVTGRVASSDPNMMNNPKRSEASKQIRRLIVARPGYLLMASDQEQCLVPETELITIDGVQTLAQVIERLTPVLTVDDDGELTFQNVVSGGSTGLKKVIEIVLEDGSSTKCSVDHRFRMWSGEWQFADQIVVGDKLMHVWSSGSDYPTWGISSRGWWVEDKQQVRKHIVVANYLAGGEVPEGYETHHEDFDKVNWVRSNIEVLTVSQHKSIHASGRNNPMYGRRSGATKTCPVCGTTFYRPPSKAHETTCSKRCSNLFFPRRPRNHKVVEIREVGMVETCQIEVENVHTYVLANGLVSKNSELRWAAEVSGDKNMKQVFIDHRDIHLATAERLIGHPKWDRLDKAGIEKGRQSAKAVNFGLLFLMSPDGFVEYSWREYGVKLTLKQAKEYIKVFFGMYPGLPKYHRRIIESCKILGYVESIFGRRRRLPEINAKNYGVKRRAERMAVNHPIQNPSSDVVLMANNEIDKRDLNPEEFRNVLFIHDELVYEVKDNSKVEDYAKIVKYEMENPPIERDFGYKMSVPLSAGISVGLNAAEMKELTI